MPHRPLIQFQSYSYRFPQIGYTLITELDPNLTNAPGYMVYMLLETSLDMIKDIMENLTDMTVDDNSVIYPHPIVVKMKLDKLIPHTDSLWASADIDYDLVRRREELLKAFATPDLYEILVVPHSTNVQDDLLTVAMPFFAETPTSEIQQTIARLKYPADPVSTHSALYRQLGVYRLNTSHKPTLEPFTFPSHQHHNS